MCIRFVLGYPDRKTIYLASDNFTTLCDPAKKAALGKTGPLTAQEYAQVMISAGEFGPKVVKLSDRAGFTYTTSGIIQPIEDLLEDQGLSGDSEPEDFLALDHIYLFLVRHDGGRFRAWNVDGQEKVVTELPFDPARRAVWYLSWPPEDKEINALFFYAVEYARDEMQLKANLQHALSGLHAKHPVVGDQLYMLRFDEKGGKWINGRNHRHSLRTASR